MTNKQLYKDTFDSLKMSEEGLRKVRNMSEKRKTVKRGFRVAVAVAALAIVVAAGNAGIYAATGDTLIDKVTQQVSIYINGQKAEDSDYKTYTNEDGSTTYEVTVPDDGSGDAKFYITEKMLEENGEDVKKIKIEDGVSAYSTEMPEE